ncbi:hypothetical protein YPPY54_1264, partial [Yersinia pestis PY-54]
MFQTEHLSATR